VVVIASNLGGVTDYRGRGFSWFSSVQDGKCGDCTFIRPWLFPSKSFTIHLSSVSIWCCIAWDRLNTLAARLEAWTVFVCSNTGVVGSNPTRGVDVCVYSVFVLPCVGSGLEVGWFPTQEVLPTVYMIIRPWRWKRYVRPKRRLACNGLHGIVS
jgi:hypothetical protein